MRSGRAAILDSNVVLESVKTGQMSEVCGRLLRSVGDGDLRVVVEPLVVHELTYIIPRYLKQATREKIAQIILSVLHSPGAEDPAGLLIQAVMTWRDIPELSFVDAYLGTLAEAQGRRVFTLNKRDFDLQGVDAPDLRELMGTG